MTANSVRGLAFELGRVTLEFTSPMLIGTGRGDAHYDTSPMADANGLPTLPGTSLAGVLRHTWATATGRKLEDPNNPFGYQVRDSGAASGVEISFGQIHDGTDRPVPFRAPDLELDATLRAIKEGVVRDHVRINARGVVDKSGKFDTQAVPKGVRFTFEVRIHEGCEVSLQELVGWLSNPAIKLGAKTRSGLGEFEVVRAVGRKFDLRNSRDFEDLSRVPRALHEPVPSGLLHPIKVESEPIKNLIRAEIRLKPEADWLFGGGLAQREDHKKPKSDEFVDRVNANEHAITWRDNRGSVPAETVDVLPGSSIKGALRHRVAFHVRRMKKEWAETDSKARTEDFWSKQGPDTCAEVNYLFGSIKDSHSGTPGRLSISDGEVHGDRGNYRHHVSLDRFTQGPMDGLLFDEAPRHGGELTFKMSLNLHRPDGHLHETAIKALHCALDDLCCGRLAFGASGSRGLGLSNGGSVTWHDPITPDKGDR